MFIGEVIGNVWGAPRHPSLQGKRLLLVRPVDPMTGRPIGEAVLAVDGGVEAGPGSVVVVVDEGNSARQILRDPKAPTRTVVCAIVDQVSKGGRDKGYA